MAWHLEVNRSKIPYALDARKAQTVRNLLRVLFSGAYYTYIYIVLLNILYCVLIVHYIYVINLDAYKSWIYFKNSANHKSGLVVICIVYYRLSQIACTHNDHFVLFVKSQYGADLIVQRIYIVAVALLSEATEIIKVLSYLRCSVADKLAEFI